jgi:hypothetical protein
LTEKNGMQLLRSSLGGDGEDQSLTTGPVQRYSLRGVGGERGTNRRRREARRKRYRVPEWGILAGEKRARTWREEGQVEDKEQSLYWKR